MNISTPVQSERGNPAGTRGKISPGVNETAHPFVIPAKAGIHVVREKPDSLQSFFWNSILGGGDWIRERNDSFYKTNLTIKPKLNFNDSFRKKPFTKKTESAQRFTLYPREGWKREDPQIRTWEGRYRLEFPASGACEPGNSLIKTPLPAESGRTEGKGQGIGSLLGELKQCTIYRRQGFVSFVFASRVSAMSTTRNPKRATRNADVNESFQSFSRAPARNRQPKNTRQRLPVNRRKSIIHSY